MQTIVQLSLFLENRVGQLSQACRTLADAGVSLAALSIADTADFGIVRLVADDPAKAAAALRAANFTVKETPVAAVVVPDRAGGMADVVATLSAKGCDIEYAYAFAARRAEHAVLVFRFKDAAFAAAALSASGFATLGAAELEADRS